MLRKKNKLPAEVHSIDFELEYGTATIEVHKDSIEKDDNVLVIDGGASMECALLGDQLAELACKNHWEGIVVNGCIRDAAEILQINIGVKAITTHPLKSIKRGVGEKNISVDFAGISFAPGDYLYADIDGVIVTPSKLT